MFVILSVQLIFFILPYPHISNASNFLTSPFPSDHVSALYNTNDQIKVFKILFLTAAVHILLVTPI